MNTTALPNYLPGERARAVHDRVDRLLLGRATAARYRALRILDPQAAAELRAAAYRGEPIAEEPADAPQSGRAASARASVAKLLG